MTIDDSQRGKRAAKPVDCPTARQGSTDERKAGGLARLDREPSVESLIDATLVLQSQASDEQARRHTLEDGVRKVLLRLHVRLDDGRAILDLFEKERPAMTESEIEEFLVGVLGSSGAATTDAAGEMQRLFAAFARIPRGSRSRGRRWT